MNITPAKKLENIQYFLVAYRIFINCIKLIFRQLLTLIKNLFLPLKIQIKFKINNE